MAAFPARDRDQFAAHWAKIRADDTVVRTIVADGMVAGNIVSWQENGQILLVRVPKTLSVQVTPHVRTRGGRRRGDHVDGCRDV